MGKYLLRELSVSLIGGALALGCGSEEGIGSGQSNDLGAERTTTNTAPVLFRDPAVSGPRLDVFDFGGDVAISVSAPIGTELPQTRPDATLTDVYRALHPASSSIPSELRALDLRIEPLLKKIVPSSVAVPTATVDKSQSAFNSLCCVDQSNSQFSYWRPVTCTWAPTNSTNLSLGSTVQPSDRVYGWNASDTTAQLLWYGQTTTVYNFFISAYTYNWTTVYSGGPYNAELISFHLNGDRGLTRHVLVQIVK